MGSEGHKNSVDREDTDQIVAAPQLLLEWMNEATIIWATSSQNLLLPYANNKGADQPSLHIRAVWSAPLSFAGPLSILLPG